jgi:hypothetical protein
MLTSTVSAGARTLAGHAADASDAELSSDEPS